MVRKYKLDDDGNPQECTMVEWCNYRAQFETCHVAYDQFDQGFVSTSFIGLDTSLYPSRPMVFETYIEGPGGDVMEKYATLEDARIGHQRWVLHAMTDLKMILKMKGAPEHVRSFPFFSLSLEIKIGK